MKSIILTNHVLEQVKSRKKISWAKATFFLRSKFESMLKDENAQKYDAWKWTYKIIVWSEKIVYDEQEDKYILITYIKKTEYDRIEYKILNLINYYANKK